MDLKRLIFAKLGMNSYKIASNQIFSRVSKENLPFPAPIHRLYVASQEAANEFSY